VLTQYTQALGLSPALAFHDVYSITEPELLAFVPRPVHALLLVFPVTSIYENYRLEQDKGRDLYLGEEHVHGEVMWFRQTIGNACGTMGVIHAVFNGEIPHYLSISNAFRSNCSTRDSSRFHSSKGPDYEHRGTC
jgi:ubiquitin carboxyl-terminal hydrolase L3